MTLMSCIVHTNSGFLASVVIFDINKNIVAGTNTKLSNIIIHKADGLLYDSQTEILERW